MSPPRLSAVDASFLYLEQPRTPMHVGAVGIFRAPAGGFDYERLVEMVERRLVAVPRYRQKVRHVPGELARPVWVDDADFDVAFHVRRSALPRPGTSAQLTELVARLMSRPLDPDRPLWEVYLVEGLADGRFAIITKTHQAMVDGVTTIDIGQVLLDPTLEPREVPDELWMPRPEPSGRPASSSTRSRRRSPGPGQVVDTVRATANDALSRGGPAGPRGRYARRHGRDRWSAGSGSPLNVDLSTQRRFAVARGDLDGVPGGAHRPRMHGERRRPDRRHRRAARLAALPRRARDLDQPRAGDGAAVGARPRTARGRRPGAVDARRSPVGEPSPALRLQHVAHAMREHTAGNRSVRAATLARIGGYAPPTLHALGARAVNGISKRIFNLVVTNVPGPQVPLYAAGARMLETYPVVPLADGQGLAVGVTSYDGGLFYGFNADRDALPDVDVLAATVDEAFDEPVRRWAAPDARLHPRDLADAAQARGQRPARPGRAARRSRSRRSCASRTRWATTTSSSTPR